MNFFELFKKADIPVVRHRSYLKKKGIRQGIAKCDKECLKVSLCYLF